MKVVTLDFETYYDQDYSLSKMTTEEYINDVRFEIICVSVRDIHGDYHVIDGAKGIDAIRNHLFMLGVGQYPLLCHHTRFDAAILRWKLDIAAPLYLDSMGMAAALIRSEAGGTSLAKVAEYFHLPPKGKNVMAMKGRRRSSLSPTEFKEYSNYCIHDVSLSHNSFLLMEGSMPRKELLLIDRMVRMYIEPTLLIDTDTCSEGLKETEAEKEKWLQVTGVGEEVLASNTQFAALLAKYVTIPRKVSPTNGTLTSALSKSDDKFIQLRHHPNPTVRNLVEARLCVKSTIDRTRFSAFLEIAERNDNKLPVPLMYYGAHTGRAAGADGINLQNLRRGSKLRKALVAPKGCYVVAADQRQIEARVNACWSGQTDLVEDFAEGKDVYSLFATELYKHTVTEATHPTERFVGKTCILGLGYSMGADRLQDTLKVSQPISSDFARECVTTYRTRYPMIVKNWRRGDAVLLSMQGGGGIQWGPIRSEYECLVLPNGLRLHYPELRRDSSTGEFIYHERVRAARVGAKGEWTRLYGAKLVENCVQALSRIILMEQLVELSLKWRVVLTVHDEIVFVVRKEQVDEAKAHISRVMRTPPAWMPELPVDITIKHGESYGDCK